MRYHYDVCPECDLENPEKHRACAACDNRLFSDDEESHRRYVTLVQSEHRKRTLYWFSGWTLICVTVVPPILLLAAGKISRAPSIGALVAALVIGWRLLDLKRKRQGSERFLTTNKSA